MPRLPGINHLQAVRALEKAGVAVIREDKHMVMSVGLRTLTIPRHNPADAFTKCHIAHRAGFTPEEFRKPL